MTTGNCAVKDEGKKGVHIRTIMGINVQFSIIRAGVPFLFVKEVPIFIIAGVLS